MDLHKIISLVPGVVYQFCLRPDGSSCVPYASEAIREIYRLNPEDVREDASRVFAIVHPDDLENHLASIQASAREMTPWQNEYRLKFDDGTVRWLYGNALPQREADGSILWHGFITDITERKRIEDELKQTKERYDFATAIGKVGTWDWNPVTGNLIWSDETFRLLGLTPGSAMPSYELFLSKVHPDDRALLDSAVQAALRDKKPYALDCRILAGNGEELACCINGKVEFDAKNQPIRMLGTIHDITERKRLEQEREQFRRFFLLSTDLMCIADPFGCFKQVNPAFTQLTGFRESELVAKPFLDFVLPEDRQRTAEEMKLQVVSRPSMNFENRYVCKDGRIIFLSWTAYFDKKDGITYATARDITEQKQAEEELRASEQKFMRLFMRAPIPLGVVNKNGAIVYFNDQFTEVFGYTTGDVPTLKEWWQLAYPDESYRQWVMDSWDAAVAKAAKEGTVIESAEYKVTCKSGAERIVMIGGSSLEDDVLATFIDVTERKKAQAALQESEYRWKFALEGAGDGLWDWNVAEGTVFFSRRWKEMLGFAEDEIGNSLDEWEKRIHPDDKVETLATVQAYLDGKTSAYRSEHRVSCKDGSWKWILDRGMVVSRSEDGKPLRIIGTHTDITERKLAEEQIHNLAFYDTLTLLPNRRMLNDRTNQAMASSKRSGRYCALLFIDLDNFKPLNDTYGHAVGDLLLTEVARRISSCVREMDTVARFGGDEFVVMLSELDADKVESTAQAGIVAEKIRIILAEPYVLKFQQEGNAETTIEHRCTASIGVALFINHEATPEEVLKWADIAMYQAKERGRNRVHFYGS